MFKVCSPAEQQAAIAATASSAVILRLLMKMPTLFTRCSVSSVGRCWPALLGAPACGAARAAQNQPSILWQTHSAEWITTLIEIVLTRTLSLAPTPALHPRQYVHLRTLQTSVNR